MKAPLISVILGTFNGASRGFLTQAIDSVIAQSVRDFELIVVDDGSTDGTAEVCHRYTSDPRVRLVRKPNGGIASARNAGIAEARGDLLCFIDDDDVWMPEKLARQLAAFEQETPKPGLVYCAIEITDSEGHVIGAQYHPVPANPYRALFYENVVDATSGVMVSAEALAAVGKFREEIFSGVAQACEDRDLWTRIARKFKIVSIPEPLVRYRMHPVKLSTTADVMEPSEIKMLEVALAEAPDDIKSEKEKIYLSLYTRFAFNRFSTGDYDAFVKHYRTAQTYGHVPAGLRGRYILAIFPPAIPLLRRILSLMKMKPRADGAGGLA